MTVRAESPVITKKTAPSSDEAVNEIQSADSLSAAKKSDSASLITVEAAKQQINEEVLSALAEKFKGKLSEVRAVDSKDILF